MPRVKEELDADHIKTNEPTEYKNEVNRFELPCGVCGKTLFVDQKTVRDFERALEHDLDNQFICNDCEREYEDLAYE